MTVLPSKYFSMDLRKAIKALFHLVSIHVLKSEEFELHKIGRLVDIL